MKKIKQNLNHVKFFLMKKLKYQGTRFCWGELNSGGPQTTVIPKFCFNPREPISASSGVAVSLALTVRDLNTPQLKC